MAVILCGAIWFSLFGNRIFWKETTITFLDVGQGDAAVISTYDGKHYLIDGGGEYGKEFGENVGKTVLLPYLQYLGADRMDGAFLSHPDSDHMTGLLEILEYIPVDALYLAEYPYENTVTLDFLKEKVEKSSARLYTVKNKSGSSGDIWECLYPMEGVTFQDKDDNHGSMVLKYTQNGTSVLFTGDITIVDETLMIEKDLDLSVDIIKVAHHGSAYSSGSAFLKKTGAEAAIISCGEYNLYGHPHQKMLERLQDAEMDIYRTDQDATVLVKLKRNGIYEIETMAERKPFYERIKETMEKW